MSRIWQVIGSQGIIAGLEHQLGQETAHSAPPISGGGCSQEEVLFIYATPGTKPRDCPTSVLRHWLLPLFSPLICSFIHSPARQPWTCPRSKTQQLKFSLHFGREFMHKYWLCRRTSKWVNSAFGPGLLGSIASQKQDRPVLPTKGEDTHWWRTPLPL